VGNAMSSERRAKGIFVAIVVWCIILFALGALYKFVIRPYFAGRLETSTGSESQYEHTVRVALDSFSGYCILRSPAVRDQLKTEHIKLDFVDDQADYASRMKALRAGDVDMAVFTVDSFVLNGAKQGDFPASIILVIDETKGADAIVAHQEGVKSIRDLDSPDARFVMTPDSPSEFLARIVIAHFSLPSLPEHWWIESDGAGDVYKAFRAARETDKRAYVLWEPYVSKALEEPGAHVLIDSSKLKGYIVDVLVAERRFLREHPDTAAAVVDAYLRAAFSYAGRDGALADLVAEDAKTYGAGALKAADAEKIASGIQWKNTLENYAHFGLLPQAESRGLPHLEDIIANISDVLTKTGAFEEDPLGAKASTIFYDRILRDLQAQDFHPGRKLDILDSAAVGLPGLAGVRVEAVLPALSEAQWASLVPVGELRIKPIMFGRGTARLNVQSRRELEHVVKRLRSFPQYYLVVRGHALAKGDPEANARLAEERATVTAQTLIEMGLEKDRIKAGGVEPSAGNGSAQSVSFLVGQLPF